MKEHDEKLLLNLLVVSKMLCFKNPSTDILLVGGKRLLSFHHMFFGPLVYLWQLVHLNDTAILLFAVATIRAR